MQKYVSGNNFVVLGGSSDVSKSEMLQVLKAQVQVQVQVLETICQVQPKYTL